MAAQSWAVGERAQGMGGAFVAVADDASAIYWNPAGLATGSIFDAQLDLTSPHGALDGADPPRTLFFGAAMPALGLAYYRVRSAVSTSDDRKNGGSGEVRVSTLDTSNVGASVLQTIVNGLVVGSTVRLVTGASQTALDLDLATMASIGSVRVGVTARNLRESVQIQRQVRLGAAYVPRERPTGVLGPFSAAFDVDLTRNPASNGDQRQLAIGSEQWWDKGLVGTRFGVHWSTLGAKRAAVAAGLTVKLPHSLSAEGHVTKGQQSEGSDWGAGVRVTF